MDQIENSETIPITISKPIHVIAKDMTFFRKVMLKFLDMVFRAYSKVRKLLKALENKSLITH